MLELDVMVTIPVEGIPNGVVVNLDNGKLPSMQYEPVHKTTEGTIRAIGKAVANLPFGVDLRYPNQNDDTLHFLADQAVSPDNLNYGFGVAIY